MHLQEESGSVFSEFSDEVVVDSNKVSVSLFFLQFEHALLSEAVPTCPDQLGASGLASCTGKPQRE